MRKWFLFIVPTLLVFLVILLSDQTRRKIVFYNFSDIDDYMIFPSRTIKASSEPFRFHEAVTPTRVPQFVTLGKRHNIPLDEFLESVNTIAFLVIKNDTLIYEEYFDRHTADSISMSFSVTKALFSALIGVAIADGYIHSVEQPVTDYIPELISKDFVKVKLRHLLQMTSGMGYEDCGLLNNPFGKQARLSYTDKLVDELLDVYLDISPGTTFLYKSIDNALLALVLHRVLTPMTLTEYMQKKIWTPLGMESDALWSIDHESDGLEKTWCCISATARDLAKFGRLYMRGGDWNGKTIIPHDWVVRSTCVDTTEGSPPQYQYGWWIMSERYGDFRAEGVRGQFIYVNPAKDIIIVRLGKSRGGLSWKEWKDFFTYMAEHIS